VLMIPAFFSRISSASYCGCGRSSNRVFSTGGFCPIRQVSRVSWSPRAALMKRAFISLIIASRCKLAHILRKRAYMAEHLSSCYTVYSKCWPETSLIYYIDDRAYIAYNPKFTLSPCSTPSTAGLTSRSHRLISR
jgi:hypothetical protein